MTEINEDMGNERGLDLELDTNLNLNWVDTISKVSSSSGSNITGKTQNGNQITNSLSKKLNLSLNTKHRKLNVGIAAAQPASKTSKSLGSKSNTTS